MTPAEIFSTSIQGQTSNFDPIKTALQALVDKGNLFETSPEKLWALIKAIHDAEASHVTKDIAFDALCVTPSAVKPMVMFASEILSFWFEGGIGSIDGAEVQEIGVRTGALVAEPYDPEKHADTVFDSEGYEPGDTLYLPSYVPAEKKEGE